MLKSSIKASIFTGNGGLTPGVCGTAYVVVPADLHTQYRTTIALCRSHWLKWISHILCCMQIEYVRVRKWTQLPQDSVLLHNLCLCLITLYDPPIY